MFSHQPSLRLFVNDVACFLSLICRILRRALPHDLAEENSPVQFDATGLSLALLLFGFRRGVPIIRTILFRLGFGSTTLPLGLRSAQLFGRDRFARWVF